MSDDERAPVTDELTVRTSLLDANLLPMGLQDVEQVRLLLNGDSVVDWRRLAFLDQDHVAQYLAVAGFQEDEPADFIHLGFVHRQAVEYLETNFDRVLPTEISDPDDVRDLLLIASRDGPLQRDACMLLKIMHIIYHVGGRELLYRLPTSTTQLFHEIETRVYDTVDGMKAAGIQVAEFAGSRKSPESIITKLLARTDSLATEVHDRLRFRVVTETRADLLAALVYLLQHLIPFNYVLAGESKNDLVDLEAVLAEEPATAGMPQLLQRLSGLRPERAKINQFSAQGFSVVNFVADLPVRVDEYIHEVEGYRVRDGRVVFLLTEFQLVDRQTDLSNNSGPNRHSLYKKRQRQRVMERLGAEED